MCFMHTVQITYQLDEISSGFHHILSDFDHKHFIVRLWAKDKTLFSAKEEVMLEWLDEPMFWAKNLGKLSQIKENILSHDFSSIVLLGMGGSSLAPLVFKNILADGKRPFFVLDTIHPDVVSRLEAKLDLAKTLFIVASKSGTTLESNLLYQYFLHRLKDSGIDDCYRHFMAITDPTTSLEQESVECGFLQGAFGNPGIGGRYSAFSAFGLVPALLMDLDGKKLLDRALSMAESCAPALQAAEQDGAKFAAFLAANALAKKDRLFIHLSPALKSLGWWAEQLIAESLGKQGKGLVPIIADHETKSMANSCHVIIGFAHEQDLLRNQECAEPLVRITLGDAYDIAATMYLFEVATALAGAALALNPFDQPDVEKSKKLTKGMIDQLRSKTSRPSLKDNVPDLNKPNISHFLSSVSRDDYVAILSYLDDNEKNAASLNQLATSIEDKLSVPVIVQIGPRYLHSTGQLFKGGRNNGHFLIVTGPYKAELPSNVPEVLLSDIHKSQALGDAMALQDCGRHVLHVDFEDYEPDLKLLYF